MRQSEDTQIEQAMLEDKMKATDWEATSEAIEEQVARESYLDWLRENERRIHQQRSPSGTTSTTELRSPRTSTSSARNSPKPATPLMEHQQTRKSPNASPKASGSHEVASSSSPIASPAPGTSSSVTSNQQDWGLGPGFQLAETATFLGQLPPDMFGNYIWVYHEYQLMLIQQQ